MESCGMSTIKYLLFAFNFIFSISGLGIIIAGALVLADVKEHDHFMENRILATPIVLIVAGAIVFIVAFLGCFGAAQERPALLNAFAICLLVIFIIELAVGITAAVYRNDFQSALKESLKKSMMAYNNNEIEKTAWDNVQQKLKCCGVTNADDWATAKLSPPESCKEESTIYLTGCYDKLKEKVHDKATVLIGVGIGIAFVEIIGIILACWLAWSITNDNPK